MIAQRMEIEEIEQLHTDKEFFVSREFQMREQLMTDMSLMKRRLKSEANDSNKDFHSQHVHLDELLVKLKLREEKLRTMDKSEDGTQKKIEEMVQAAKERYDRLRRRTALEMEGYNNEENILRTKLKNLEKLISQSNRRRFI